jgi:transcriptional regulator with XRE-family HTH domain
MADMLLAGSDDGLFSTDRTEAQAHEVCALPVGRALDFLGSRVRSFRASPDRVIVYEFRFSDDAADRWWSRHMLRRLVGDLPVVWNPSDTSAVLAIVGFASAVAAHDIPQTDPPADGSERPEAALESAIAELKDMLGITDSDIEDATGISRSTLWRLRERGTTPRAATATKVWRLHALATALVRTLGADGAQGWLNAGDPSPRTLLVRGDLADVERRADSVLFAVPTVRSHAAPAEDDYSQAPDMLPLDVPPTRQPGRARRAPRQNP